MGISTFTSKEFIIFCRLSGWLAMEKFFGTEFNHRATPPYRPLKSLLILINRSAWVVFFFVNLQENDTDVGQNGRPRGPQMWMSSLVLTIQLLGYLILTHTHTASLVRLLLISNPKKSCSLRHQLLLIGLENIFFGSRMCGYFQKQAKNVPSGYVKIAIEMAIYSGFSHWKWWFSIVFCTFTRG